MSTSKVFLNYTDNHDVDENERTISSYGGLWMYDGDRAGITARNLYSSSLILDSTVASSNIQKYRVIRILMMSTKTR